MNYFVSVTGERIKKTNEEKKRIQAEFDMSGRPEVEETLPILSILQKYLYVSYWVAI